MHRNVLCLNVEKHIKHKLYTLKSKHKLKIPIENLLIALSSGYESSAYHVICTVKMRPIRRRTPRIHPPSHANTTN